MDLLQINQLGKNDLKMEFLRLKDAMILVVDLLLIQWSPPLKDCTKLNVDIGWKDNEATLANLTRNKLEHV